MTAENKLQIVRMHNVYRNYLALGMVADFPKAARMGQLVCRHSQISM